jgi:hypothetical protein
MSLLPPTVVGPFLVVVDAEPPMQAGTGTPSNIRIGRSDDRIGELSKLLFAAEGFVRFNAAVEELFRGNAADALDEIASGLSAVPGDVNMRFLRAGALIASGSVQAGTEELPKLIAGRRTWEIIVRSSPRKASLPPLRTIRLTRCSAPSMGREAIGFAHLQPRAVLGLLEELEERFERDEQSLSTDCQSAGQVALRVSTHEVQPNRPPSTRNEVNSHASDWCHRTAFR